MKNYEFGRIVNGKIEHAPYPLKVNGYDVYGASEEQYSAQGYKRIVIVTSESGGENKSFECVEKEKEIVINYYS